MTVRLDISAPLLGPTKKYPGVILAIDKAYAIDDLGFKPGINTLALPFFLNGVMKLDREKYPSGRTTDLASRLSLRERHFLETSPDFVQPLNYITLKKTVLTALMPSSTGGREYDHREYESFYSTYYRKKGVGESRLEDKMSIGWGGHTEFKSVTWNQENIIDYVATMMNNIMTELLEELNFEIDGTAQKLRITLALDNHLAFKGFLWDPSDKVGQHHLALLWELEIPEHVTVTSREHEQLFGPWVNKAELAMMRALNDGKYFENWSNIVIDAILGDVNNDDDLVWDEISLDVNPTSFWTDAYVFGYLADPSAVVDALTLPLRQEDDYLVDELRLHTGDGEVSVTTVGGVRIETSGEVSITAKEVLLASAPDDTEFAQNFLLWAQEAGWSAAEATGVFDRLCMPVAFPFTFSQLPKEEFEFKKDRLEITIRQHGVVIVHARAETAKEKPMYPDDTMSTDEAILRIEHELRG